VNHTLERGRTLQAHRFEFASPCPERIIFCDDSGGATGPRVGLVRDQLPMPPFGSITRPDCASDGGVTRMLCPRCFCRILERTRRHWWEKILASVVAVYRGTAWRCCHCGRRFLRSPSPAPATLPIGNVLSENEGQPNRSLRACNAVSFACRRCHLAALLVGYFRHDSLTGSCMPIRQAHDFPGSPTPIPLTP